MIPSTESKTSLLQIQNINLDCWKYMMWKMIYVKTKHSKLLHNINIQHNKYDGNDFDGETIFFPGK